jgi:hypothetical protein
MTETNVFLLSQPGTYSPSQKLFADPLTKVMRNDARAVGARIGTRCTRCGPSQSPKLRKKP